MYGWHCDICDHEEAPYHYDRLNAYDQYRSHVRRDHGT
jgi:hypothetical protein